MERRLENICVIGLGYVGLPTAATFASCGINVVGVDIRDDVIDRLNSGETHIIEPDLDMIVRAVVKMGTFRASRMPEAADAYLIAVPTPLGANNVPDMSAVQAATSSIAPYLRPGALVVIESTSPVGTTFNAAVQLQKLRPDLSFAHTQPETSDIMLAYCPERVLPGQTLRELVDNARIIGGLDHRSTERACELYRHFVRGEIISATANEAELVKLSENTFRDVNIAFANELSMVCERLQIDVGRVIRAANLHPRVSIMSPGPGVGGHCIPIDPWFIHHAAPEITPLIRTAREVNQAKTEHVIQRILSKTNQFSAPKIALLGLTYKPDIDDIRESPSFEIAEALAKRRVGKLLLVEPHLHKLPAQLAAHEDSKLTGLDDALTQADIIVALVAHKQFFRLDRTHLANKIVLDFVGLFPADNSASVAKS